MPKGVYKREKGIYRRNTVPKLSKIKTAVTDGQLWMYARNRRIYEVAAVYDGMAHLREYAQGMSKRIVPCTEILESDDWLEVEY